MAAGYHLSGVEAASLAEDVEEEDQMNGDDDGNEGDEAGDPGWPAYDPAGGRATMRFDLPPELLQRPRPRPAAAGL